MLWPCQKRAASPLQSYGARNGTSHSARNSCLSDPPLANPNAPCQALYGPGVAAHVNAILTRALGTPKRMPGSLCTQTVCARNMRHLKTLGRATNLSTIKIHHVERHTGREWRVHPHMHRHTPHAYFGPAQTPPWTRLHSKRAHNVRHFRERAHLLDERATSRSSKCSISSAAPVLSGVLMHTPVGTLRTRALASLPTACREPFAVIWCSQWHLS